MTATDSPATATELRSISPVSGELLESFAAMSPAQLDVVLDAAVAAQRSWRQATLAQRAQPMRELAHLLRARVEELAALLTRETGKPVTESRAEVEKCAACADWVAAHAATMLAPETFESTPAHNLARFQPLGCVLAIMPWNYPLWQVMRAALPALMAGNAVVLKHVTNVTGCALAAEQLLADATFPRGLFATLRLETERVAPVITDPRVAGVTLTGSVRAGEAVGRLAGGALKRVVLELGGSDPFVVLDDVSVAPVVRAAVRARFQNNGQSCIAAKRSIVHAGVAQAFTARFVESVAALRVGDPMDPETQVGPMARADLRDAPQGQLERALAEGARAATGRRARAGEGWFFEPTVLTDVDRDSPVFAEETFGPLAAITVAADDGEAIALANRSPFGLGSSVWTSDPDRAGALADRLETGMVFINGIVASDPRLPFGGIKRSGIGRELSAFGIREFVNVQLGPRSGRATARRAPSRHADDSRVRALGTGGVQPTAAMHHTFAGPWVRSLATGEGHEERTHSTPPIASQTCRAAAGDGSAGRHAGRVRLVEQELEL